MFDASDVFYLYVYMWLCIVLGILTSYLFVRPVSSSVSIERRRRMVSSSEDAIRGLGYLAFWLSLVAYIIYIAISDVSIQSVMDSLSGAEGANYALREGLERIPGITSFMGVAPWWFVYVGYMKFVLGRRLPARIYLMSAALLFLIFARGVLDFERRAIIDALLPAAIVVVMMRTQWSLFMRPLISSAPFFGILMLVGLFLFTEYFRTWTFYSQYVSVDYMEWALTRLGGYYSTSMNNGATALDAGYSGQGYYLLHGFYRFPVLGAMTGLRDLGGEAASEFTLLLTELLNPEFNNQGGAVVALFDLGYAGGGVFLFCYGMVTGLVFQGARSGSLFCVLIYTFFFVAALEITRIWFITSAGPLTSLLFVMFYFAYRRVSRTQPDRRLPARSRP